VSCKCLLFVCRSLHGSQRRFQVVPNLPLVRAIRSRKPHRFESHQPRRQRVLTDCRELPKTRARRVRHDRQVAEVSVQRLGSGQNQSVQRREVLQRNLPAKRKSGVLFRSISELHCCEMLGNGSKTILGILSIKFELDALYIEASQSDVNMRMLRIEMCYGHPFDRHTEIGLDPAHYVPREALEIETLTEFRGDDQFPQPWVTAVLPCEEL
jgi:hypothetical protein